MFENEPWFDEVLKNLGLKKEEVRLERVGDIGGPLSERTYLFKKNPKEDQ